MMIISLSSCHTKVSESIQTGVINTRAVQNREHQVCVEEDYDDHSLFFIGNYNGWIDFNYAGEYNNSWDDILIYIFKNNKELVVGLSPKLKNYDFLEYIKYFDGEWLRFEVFPGQFFGVEFLEKISQAKGKKLSIEVAFLLPGSENDIIEAIVEQVNILKNIDFKEKQIVVTSGIGFGKYNCNEEVEKIISEIYNSGLNREE